VPSLRVVALLVVAATAFACEQGDATTTPAGATGASPTAEPSFMPSPRPETPTPSAYPSGLASPFGEDLRPGDVPLRSMVPAGMDPTASWIAQTVDGDAIVVAWQAPGEDPFRTDRGFVVWRHTGAPVALWRPVFASTYVASRHPVLGITASIADVTGDGSQDALLFAETGGSGACGTYLVIDAASGRSVFRRSLCDGQIEPSSDPVGLVVTEAVYAHGDPHCCPSSFRATILQRDADGGWQTVSETTTPT
jgi:hypothetical protein